MDEITVAHALIQLRGLDSESDSGRYYFGVKWGVRRRRTCTLECNTDEAYVSDILLELPALISEFEFCRTCFSVNWGIRRKRSNPLTKPFKAIQVSSSPIECRYFDLNKPIPAQPRVRRFKICRAKNSIAGYGPRYVVPI
ncbi:hypothetical protein FH972_005869 [Carpinus fangiana]|uniref:Uncharacterized protein n=1 Tax=Carpinus fangiana TaxID=176857 RepID=A0A5N6QU30_9ROSI|nr:hypothetical protein FH972_005869 [Carpinus fangiana]